jgi:hypothetical protein
MIAIPQEEYLAMSSMQNVKEPLAQQFYNLDSRYTSEEREKDPYRRMIMQSNTLDEMKQVKEQIRNSLTISTPKPYQSRANALLKTVESFLRFNNKGEIYSDDGNIIENSRVEDLIQHAVRDRRRNMTPTGWSDFLTILRDHNVPKSILNRNTLDELDGVATPMLSSSSPTSAVKRPRLKIEPKGLKLKRFKLDEEVRRQPSRTTKPTFDKDLGFLNKYKNG